MANIRIRELNRRTWVSPKEYIIHSNKIRHALDASETDKKIKNLRTQRLKEVRETWDAAVFCHGMAQIIGQDVFFSIGEGEDYDFVARTDNALIPVQLKEWVPEDLNPHQSLNELISKLSKYPEGTDITVAIKMNRATKFDPCNVVVPADVHIRQIYLFAAIDPTQSVWGLWGNFAAGLLGV